MTESLQVSNTIKRSGFIIEIQGTGASVTFHPYDKDKTYNSIIAKLKDLGEDLISNREDYEVKSERQNIDIQLTEIYLGYSFQLQNKLIKDEDQLLLVANSEIKHMFQDQTGKFYAVIQKENHDEIINMDSEEFDRFLLNAYFNGEKKMISKEKRKNAIVFLKSRATERRVLYNRIAKIGEVIYYNLNNEQKQCVRISKEGWRIIDNPLLFWPADPLTEQTPPDGVYDKKRQYVREIINTSTIKYGHQKLIDEVYTASLFIADIAHPLAVPVGPPRSGKTVHFRVKKLIVDPHADFDALVQKLPTDEKDRRVTIYDNYISYFDNESMLNQEEMDELCMWVTGFSKTIRILHTTDERRTYSGKRPLGVNGINIPVRNSDIMSRCFVTNHTSLMAQDSKDSKTRKLIERENKYLAKIKQLVPQTLGYIFDVLVKVLQTFDKVDAEIDPIDRLADWTVWGETIARAIGYGKGEFLNAWELNKQTQGYAVIQSNTLAIPLIKYAFNKRSEIEFTIEPDDLLAELRKFGEEIGFNHHTDKSLPTNSVWLTRKLNVIKSDLELAGLHIYESKSGERLIHIRKDYKTHGEQQQQQNNMEESNNEDYK